MYKNTGYKVFDLKISFTLRYVKYKLFERLMDEQNFYVLSSRSRRSQLNTLLLF